MGRATSGVGGMKFRAGDSLLSMSVIRAEQVALEERAAARPQYVFTITDGGFAKRSRITDYRLQSRGGIGIKTMSLANEDRGGLVGAFIVVDGDEILLVSRKGQAVRFRADDSQLRPMGRATSGVSGMKYAAGDSVLSMSVIRAEQVAQEELAAVKPQYVFTITDGGFAKRSRITDYRLQSRGGLGIKTMSLANEERGNLVGAFIVVDGDEVLSITQGGQVVRSPINDDFRATGRSTMGVKFVTPKEGDAVAVVARSVEAPEADDVVEEDGEPTTTDGSESGAEGVGGSAADSQDEVSSATNEETEADYPPETEA
jgi:DNA gyrase subunit A